MKEGSPPEQPPDYPSFVKRQQEILMGVYGRVGENLPGNLHHQKDVYDARCKGNKAVPSGWSGEVRGKALSEVSTPEILSPLVWTMASSEGQIWHPHGEDGNRTYADPLSFSRHCMRSRKTLANPRIWMLESVMCWSYLGLTTQMPCLRAPLRLKMPQLSTVNRTSS